MKILTLISQTLVVMAALTLVGCSSTPSAAPATEAGAAGASGGSGAPGASGGSGPIAIKTYPMHGKVISLNAKTQEAKIDSGPIGDWMPMAMTMNYLVKDNGEFAKLTPGEVIDATAFVQGDDDWIGEDQTVREIARLHGEVWVPVTR